MIFQNCHSNEAHGYYNIPTYVTWYTILTTRAQKCTEILYDSFYRVFQGNVKIWNNFHKNKFTIYFATKLIFELRSWKQEVKIMPSSDPNTKNLKYLKIVSGRWCPRTNVFTFVRVLTYLLSVSKFSVYLKRPVLSDYFSLVVEKKKKKMKHKTKNKTWYEL